MNSIPLHMDTGTVCVPITDIRVDRESRFRKDLGDIEPLKSSIMQLGLLQPIGITPEHALVYGERRLRACQELGWDVIECRIIDLDDILTMQCEQDENVVRLEFSTTERVAIASAIRERIGNRQGERTDIRQVNQDEHPDGLQLRQALDEVPQPGERTDDFVARKSGFSDRTTLARAEKIVAQGTEELKDAVDSGRVSITTGAAIADLPAEMQQQIATMDERQIVKAANEIRERRRGERKAKRDAEFNELVATGSLDINLPGNVRILCGDCREVMRNEIEPESVDMVVCSPPYNAAIPYDSHDDNMPENEFLDMLFGAWTACRRIMKPGARIAVNVVHGKGRNPYVPVGGTIIEQLSQLFVMRGIIHWDKGASGRTSWGSWRSPVNPVLRDSIEWVIIAEKEGNIDVPENRLIRLDGKLVSPWLSEADFLRLSQDHWQLAPEHDRSHPAPYPVALVTDLLKFYGWPGMTVCDPFAGSGTTGVACVEMGCDCVLIEKSEAYCRLAEARCAGVNQ